MRFDPRLIVSKRGFCGGWRCLEKPSRPAGHIRHPLLGSAAKLLHENDHEAGERGANEGPTEPWCNKGHYRAHFGLARASRVDRIVVDWEGGARRDLLERSHESSRSRARSAHAFAGSSCRMRPSTARASSRRWSSARHCALRRSPVM